MNIGLIARSDARGLGHITREFFRHVQPAKTIVVQPAVSHHAQHGEWYPSTKSNRVVTLEKWESRLPESNVRGWLEGLDVVYTAETFYDPRLPVWATEMGVATVLHANPEFYRHEALPTMIWNQSPWRHNTLPDGAIVVGTPVATDRFVPSRRGIGPLRVLHVAGVNAANDRNGTPALLAALAHVKEPVDVTLITQGRKVPIPRTSDNVRVTQRSEDGDYWAMYRDHDLLILPRRYAGNSLPAQEAMAAGLAVIMPDCSPNEWWEPVIRVPAAQTGHIQTPGGKVGLWDTCPWQLAQAIDRLAIDSPDLAAAKSAGLRWADAHSWDTMLPVYMSLFAEARDRVRG